MALFPKVQSPCPLKADFKACMEGDICRMCKRQVFDLSAMSDADRVSFMQDCEEEVCVSYTLTIRRTVAAAMLGAAIASVPAAAQEVAGTETLSEPVEDVLCLDGVETFDYDVIIVGGIKDTKGVEYIDTEADLDIPELPVTYEDEPVKTAQQGTVQRKKS